MKEKTILVDGCWIVDKKLRENRTCPLYISTEFGEYCRHYDRDLSKTILHEKKPEWCKVLEVVVREEIR